MTLVKPDLTYRHDINGLRAIAVIAVIIFHAELGFFKGGYVGVDVFFVISGYLITQRIIKGHETGGFEFKTFYLRRIRRLFPAMATTVVGTLLVGTLFLSPEALTNMAKSAISSTLSFANVHFFLESGYWDASTWAKPLLHNWSLSVEEQFYLLWPLFIVAILTFRKRFALQILVATTLLSLLVTTLYTYKNPSAAFYLTPFRIYEFTIGSLCVWLDQKTWPKGTPWQMSRSALFCLGLAIVIGSMLLFDETYPFPGWIALIPSLGTAFVILAKNPPALGFALSNPLVRYVGLISYSLYLIHWPVLVFVRLQNGAFTVRSFTLSLVLILGLSVLQYHFVETPLRRPPSVNRGALRRTLAATGLAALLVMMGSTSIIANSGFPKRYDNELQQIATLTEEQVKQERREIKKNICKVGKTGTICGVVKPKTTNILVVGDSHGIDGLNIFHAAFPDVNLLAADKGGCPLVNSLNWPTPYFPTCSQYNDARFKDIDSVSKDLDYVVFSQLMGKRMIEPMKETLNWFSERDVRPIVLGAGPQFKTDLGVLQVILRHGSLDGLDETLDSYAVKDQYVADAALKPYVERLDGAYLEKRHFFCPDGVCQIILENGAPLIFDNHHLTRQASQAFGQYIAAHHNNLLSLQR
jgi:peptidoglycan/LPS O-acetylase OafA/YrhL